MVKTRTQWTRRVQIKNCNDNIIPLHLKHPDTRTSRHHLGGPSFIFPSTSHICALGSQPGWQQRWCPTPAGAAQWVVAWPETRETQHIWQDPPLSCALPQKPWQREEKRQQTVFLLASTKSTPPAKLLQDGSSSASCLHTFIQRDIR